MSNSVRTALGWIVVVALFVSAFFIFRAGLQRMAATTPAAIGHPARDVALRALDGKPVKLSAYFGRPLWVNFFATWCVPCKAELPEIERRYVADKPRGLVVLGVDEQEESALVEPFVKRMQLSFPIALDSSGDATLVYHVGAIPTSVFIDASGSVKAVHTGFMTPDDMDQDLKKIL